MPQMLPLRYLGSKRSMLPRLTRVFDGLGITKDTVFGDLFAGTGTVAHHVSKKYGCKVVANDALYFSYLLTRAKLTHYSATGIARTNNLVSRCNALPPARGPVTKHFAPPKRKYFTVRNAMKIDAIRANLKSDKYALAALISACDKVANTTGVYGAYLKTFRPNALKPLRLEPLSSANVVPRSGTVHNKDVFDVTDEFDVAYIDPPYNTRQYAENYHVLETIARHKYDGIRGVTGRSDTATSEFATKKRAHAAFDRLLSTINAKTVVLSYNSEGLLSRKQIVDMLSRRWRVKVHTFRYKRFKSRADARHKVVNEYIFIANTP